MKKFLIGTINELSQMPTDYQSDFFDSLTNMLRPNKDGEYTSPYALAALILVRWFKINKLKTQTL